MKIGVVGSGVVGQTLASGFLKHGHEVMLSSREPEKLTDWKAQTGDKARTGTFEEAAQFGELIVFAVKGSGAEEALQLAGPQNLQGKVVIDTTNPLGDVIPGSGVLKLFTDWEESLMEQSQKQVAGARFVKAFNSVGSAAMVNPDFNGTIPTMFICGDDEAAKQQITDILKEFGWEAADMGNAIAARALEPLAVVYCIPGILHGEWTHAFKLLHH